MEHELDIEPEPSELALVRAAPEIDITQLLRFIPDPVLKARVEAAAEAAQVDPATDGVEAASAALVPVREAIKEVEERFADPVGLAHSLHKRLTAWRAEFRKPGDDVIASQSRLIRAEEKRLRDKAEAEARARQAEADRQARARAAQAAREAKAEGADPGVVDALKRAAKTAAAPPVAVAEAPALVGMTTTQRWKARFVGTPEDAEPNPGADSYTPRQQHQARKLLRAIADGKVPLAAAPIDWKYLNRRAQAERSTLAIPEVEAFDAGGSRAKR